jgi:hypothetical protein
MREFLGDVGLIELLDGDLEPARPDDPIGRIL